jgi:hypothetical protein
MFEDVMFVLLTYTTVAAAAELSQSVLFNRPQSGPSVLYGDEISGRIALQCKTATQHRVDIF